MCVIKFGKSYSRNVASQSFGNWLKYNGKFLYFAKTPRFWRMAGNGKEEYSTLTASKWGFQQKAPTNDIQILFVWEKHQITHRICGSTMDWSSHIFAMEFQPRWNDDYKCFAMTNPKGYLCQCYFNLRYK